MQEAETTEFTDLNEVQERKEIKITPSILVLMRGWWGHSK